MFLRKKKENGVIVDPGKKSERSREELRNIGGVMDFLTKAIGRIRCKIKFFDLLS